MQSPACPGSLEYFPTLPQFPVWEGKMLMAEGNERENTQQMFHLPLGKPYRQQQIMSNLPQLFPAVVQVTLAWTQGCPTQGADTRSTTLEIYCHGRE